MFLGPHNDWLLCGPRWSLSGPEILGPHNDQMVWSLSGPGRCLVLLHRFASYFTISGLSTFHSAVSTMKINCRFRFFLCLFVENTNLGAIADCKTLHFFQISANLPARVLVRVPLQRLSQTIAETWNELLLMQMCS